MSSDQGNDRITFDILGYIFSCYAVDETILHPLETLLLVCKSWSHAALGHRRLWSDLRIYLGHEPTSTIWTTRLPLRLSRCGPDIPLDIDLRNLLHVDSDQGRVDLDVNQLSFKMTCDAQNVDMYDPRMTQCECSTTSDACTRRVLEEFVGSSGQMCLRWRSLKLYVEPVVSLHKALGYATPILETLELGYGLPQWKFHNVNLLPHANRLKRLSLFECFLTSLPNCENLEDLKLSWEDKTTCPPLSSLRRARKLRVLSLGSTFDMQLPLPAQLNNLQVLKLEGIISDRALDECSCSMPRLSHLFIDLSRGNLIERSLRFQWLPVEKLTRLTITWRHMNSRTEEEGFGMMAALRSLLGRTWNLKHLEVDRPILCFIIKILWNALDDPFNESILGPDDLPGPAFKNISVTNLFDEHTVEFDGNETTSFLEDLAKKWYFLPPDLPDDEFAQRMVGTSLQFGFSMYLPSKGFYVSPMNKKIGLQSGTPVKQVKIPLHFKPSSLRFHQIDFL